TGRSGAGTRVWRKWRWTCSSCFVWISICSFWAWACRRRRLLPQVSTALHSHSPTTARSIAIGTATHPSALAPSAHTPARRGLRRPHLLPPAGAPERPGRGRGLEGAGTARVCLCAAPVGAPHSRGIPRTRSGYAAPPRARLRASASPCAPCGARGALDLFPRGCPRGPGRQQSPTVYAVRRPRR
ncbi:hypothetical protein DFH08DRAFT_899357, partial [Mycena albidolilacea]